MTDLPPRAEPPPRRPRHLLDLEDVRGSHQRSQGNMDSLNRVRTSVLSVMAVTTILHLAAAAAFTAVIADANRLDAQIGLNILAALIGVTAVATGLRIHGKSPLSPWLLLGILPGLIGAAIIFA